MDSPAAPTMRLLIADDNDEFRKSTEMMVSLENDIEVVSLARDGQEAVELARQYRPDVAVIDLRIPKEGGVTAPPAPAPFLPSPPCVALFFHGAARNPPPRPPVRAPAA